MTVYYKRQMHRNDSVWLETSETNESNRHQELEFHAVMRSRRQTQRKFRNSSPRPVLNFTIDAPAYPETSFPSYRFSAPYRRTEEQQKLELARSDNALDNQ